MKLYMWPLFLVSCILPCDFSCLGVQLSTHHFGLSPGSIVRVIFLVFLSIALLLWVSCSHQCLILFVEKQEKIQEHKYKKENQPINAMRTLKTRWTRKKPRKQEQWKFQKKTRISEKMWLWTIFTWEENVVIILILLDYVEDNTY